LFLAFLVHTNAFCLLNSGTTAPEFAVVSGDDRHISLSHLKGTVITVFYETRDKETTERNRELKNELNRFYISQPDSIRKHVSKLAIINCSAAFWPFKEIWKKNLVKNSIKEEMTIYGDWDGRFFEDYLIVKDESNFIIIDKTGKVRYSKAGRVEKIDFSAIKQLLEKLVSENS